MKIKAKVYVQMSERYMTLSFIEMDIQEKFLVARQKILKTLIAH